MNKILTIFLILVLTSPVFAQFAFRLEADILTKTSLPDSTFQISKGKIHYDKNFRKIIFDFTFPNKEKVVLFDTIMYRFQNNQLLGVSPNFLIPNQSFFHFILSGDLKNFGFDEANFTASGIEKKKDLIITTWIPPEHVKPFLSKILVATKNKQLYSITMMGPNGKVINRQILKNYQLIDGIDIPHEVLIATYLDNGKMYQVITLNNVVLNNQSDVKSYDYEL
jgi:hypothetical protein